MRKATGVALMMSGAVLFLAAILGFVGLSTGQVGVVTLTEAEMSAIVAAYNAWSIGLGTVGLLGTAIGLTLVVVAVVCLPVAPVVFAGAWGLGSAATAGTAYAAVAGVGLAGAGLGAAGTSLAQTAGMFGR